MNDGQCVLDPECEHGLHAASDHPCGKRPPPPGTPCEYCGKPLAPDPDEPRWSAPCPDCWRPATIADLKAFAAEEGWDTTLTIGEVSL